MSQLIKLTVVSRRGDVLTTPTAYGFDVEDIVSPIKRDGSESFFDSRMMKGTKSANNNLAKVEYRVQETLNEIAALSDKLIVLNVLKRRGVDMGGERHIFVTSRISENITTTTLGSTKFFYSEDGDSLPVEYELDHSIDEIIAQSNLPATTVVELTWQDAQDMRDAGLINPVNGFVPGLTYNITDANETNGGVFVKALTETQLSLDGEGLFLVPDFQDVGDYSALTTPKGVNQGVWHPAGEGSYTDGDIVFFNGRHFQVYDANNFDGSDPVNNASAYQFLPKSVTNGYILENDFIRYDFDANSIIYRADKRGNEVYSFVSDFQWGNNNVFNNVDKYDTFYCINQRGSISQCINNSSNAINITNGFTSTLTQCTFGESSYMTIEDCGIIANCTFNADIPINLKKNVTYNGNRIERGFSDFSLSLDYSDPGIFAANTLTLPTEYNYIGIFELTDNAGATVTRIVNLPTNHVVRFYGERHVSGTKNTIFSHTSIAVAVSDELVSDAAIANTVTGRINGCDFIEYKRDGNLNVRQNIVIMA